MKKFMYIAAAALLGLTACTEDYKDWTPQEQPTQPATVTFGNGSVTEVGVIDLNALAEGQETVQVASIKAPTASDESYAPVYTLNIGEETYAIDAEGNMSAAELQDIIANLYGRKPVARDVTATISMWVSDGATAVKTATSDAFIINAIPQAPTIEAAYYLTGSINGWDNSDTTYKLTNDGSDPYTNQTFKLRIPAPEDGSNVEFKMTPESGLGGDWSGCLAAGSEEGKFVYNNAGGNFVITADPDALFYDITFNMLDQTWKATPVGFNEFIYEIGNESGWSEPHPLYGNGQGQYEAVIYLNGEFKFKPNKDNWDGDWEKASGDATAGTLTTDGGPNVDAVEAGSYYVQVDLKEMTYKLTPITSIGIIGNGGDWNNDIEMTYNENLKCWEARTALAGGEFKFRANHDWAINWGGSFDNLTQGGSNLSVAEAGDYVVRLYLCDEAPAHCTVKADSGYPDFIYEIGNESGWSTSHALLGNGAGLYTGIYYLNGEFKFKPNADNWDDDYEKASGDAYAGTLKQDGGPNVDAPETGLYLIEVDLSAMTYQLTALTVGIIGNGGDWNNDIEMTYNTDAGCMEVTTELAAGEFKFRANHDWAINWGGSFDNLTQDGGNLSVAEAGTYKVQLFLSYAGKHHCTLTKQ
ncbi:MAG: SusF/SusE family outer membrane protein [Bacteroidales bacterium]|nr:SusF/SusE family outer membrane protein [Bacteroidales bacterium]